jgi:type 1 fimbria pilin
MKKTLLAAIFVSLLISSFFVSPATAVIITIKGGFGCTVTIENNENHTINANISIVSHRIFTEGGGNITGHGGIKPHHSTIATLRLPAYNPFMQWVNQGIRQLYEKGFRSSVS